MKLFISYSSDDKAWVYELWRNIRDELHHDVWINKRLVAAEDWWDSILESIETADTIVFVMTPKSVGSIYCQAEIAYAQALNKPILPLMLKPCDYPDSLQAQQIQFDTLTDEMSMDRVLLRVTMGLMNIQQRTYEPQHTPRPALPEPKQNPEHVFEVFALAEEAAVEGNITLAQQFFGQVIDTDPDGLGVAAKERLDAIMQERDRATAYEQVKRMAENPRLIAGARAAWRSFVRTYGNDYDPDGLAVGLEEENWNSSKSKDVGDTEEFTGKLQESSLQTLSAEPIDKSGQRFLVATVKAAEEQYEFAVKLVRELDKASVSLLIRHLKVGRHTAECLMELMEMRGVVGAYLGDNKPRVILQDYSSLPEPIQRAYTFTGQRNKDWDPSFIEFRNLKIPDMMFCLVPVGRFQMGSDERKRERPIHSHALSKPFWISKYPITNAQWQKAVEKSVVQVPQDSKALKWYYDSAMANAPVVGINWYEATKYAQWLGCTLPTEVEWEYSAGGIESWRYPWGNEWNFDRCIWRENSGCQPHDVTTMPEGASWVGALHLTGNVWEWTRFPNQQYPYNTEIETSTGYTRADSYVLRGGSFWFDSSLDLRITNRNSRSPNSSGERWGFRVVRAVKRE